MFGLNILRACWQFLKTIFKVFKLWIPALGIALLLVLTSLFHIEDGTFGNVLSVIVLAPFIVAWVLGMLQSIIRIGKKDFSWGDLFSSLSLPGLPGNKDRVGFKSKEKGVSVDQLNGIVIGKKGNKYIQQDVSQDGHTLVIGGAGSGKTTGVVIPTLQKWQGRAFFIDIKPELYDASKKAPARMENGRSNVMVFDPADSSTFGYDPLYMVRNSDNPSQAAHMIADILVPLPTGNTDPVWARGGQSILVAGILYYLTEDRDISFASLIEKIRMQSPTELISMVMNGDETNELIRLAKMEVSDKMGADEKTIASFASELQGLSIFATDTQLVSTLNNSRPILTPDDLEKHDVCIRIQESKLDVWGKLLGMITAQFLKSFEMRPNNAAQPTLFCLDECPRLGKIDGLQNALATLRSKAVRIMIICQSKSQLDSIYGKDVTKAILDNCSNKIVLRSTEFETQDYLSKSVGTIYQKTKSTSSNTNNFGMNSVSVSEQERRIIKPEEFGFLKDDLIYLSSQGYSRLKKIKCWQEPEFSKYM